MAEAGGNPLQCSQPDETRRRSNRYDGVFRLPEYALEHSAHTPDSANYGTVLPEQASVIHSAANFTQQLSRWATSRANFLCAPSCPRGLTSLMLKTHKGHQGNWKTVGIFSAAVESLLAGLTYLFA